MTANLTAKPTADPECRRSPAARFSPVPLWTNLHGRQRTDRLELLIRGSRVRIPPGSPFSQGGRTNRGRNHSLEIGICKHFANQRTDSKREQTVLPGTISAVQGGVFRHRVQHSYDYCDFVWTSLRRPRRPCQSHTAVDMVAGAKVPWKRCPYWF